jgi:hypothetical protein
MMDMSLDSSGKKEDLISKIISIEWDMFSNVKNRGGKASCQEDPVTFRILRTSNFMTWSEPVLESYVSDLETANLAGRNLMTEKYARMEGIIAPLNPDGLPLIDKIVKRECKWLEDMQEKYPGMKMARPIYSSQDTPAVVSSETYLSGELETYSPKTLELYHKDNMEMEAKGMNRIEIAAGIMSKKFREINDRQ